jgi:hypothetical protein
MILADWEEMFGSLTGVLTVTLLFGGWIIVAVIGSLGKNWRKVHESEHMAALKQSMIERGMSVEEIERVLRAGPAGLEDSRTDSTCDQSKKLAELSKRLAEHGVPAPAMEQILGTFRTAGAGERKNMTRTVVAMLDGGADTEQVLAVVRALSRNPQEPTQERRFPDDAASFRH